jgi:hypothetical protein
MEAILLSWVPYRAGIFQDRKKIHYMITNKIYWRIVHRCINERPSRNNNEQALSIPSCKTDSLYPRTIKEWNTLPNCTVSALSPESFKVVASVSNISCSPSLNHLQSMEVILLSWVPYRAGIFQGRKKIHYMISNKIYWRIYAEDFMNIKKDK